MNLDFARFERRSASSKRRARTALGLVVALVAGVLAIVGALATTAAPVQAAVDPNPAAIAAGSSHTCAITAAGGAACWGGNTSGQLGNGSTTTALEPTPVTGLSSGVTALAASANTTCAIVGGAAKCWGEGANGRLGNGTTTSSSVPVPVTGLDSGVTDLSVGSTSACAVVSGEVRCWGYGANGRLGNGAVTDSATPVQVAGLPPGVTAVAVGNDHACVVVAGESWCWGSNQWGQSGDGTGTNANRLTPVRTLDISGITAISAGSAHTCAVASGGVLCWGQGNRGQAGYGATTTPSGVRTVIGLTSGVTAISVKDESSCALTASGASCWGWNSTGQMGTGLGGAYQTYAINAVAGTTGATVISMGGSHACVLVDGQAKCWGSNLSGQFGDGSRSPVAAPTQVTGLGSGVTAIAAGANHSCAVVDAGAQCWGAGQSGQLGRGTTPSSSAAPAAVSGLTSGVTAISAMADHTCAVASGAAYCWGANGSGQLGNGSTESSAVPVGVTGLTSNVTAIAAGVTHSCAVVNGAAWCWGANESGQLGNGTTTASTVPVPVSTLTSGVTAIAVGTSHTCAVMSGAAYCWGNGGSGRLGLGNAANSSVPAIQTSNRQRVTAVAAGSRHGCSISTASNLIRCWGDNLLGPIGVWYTSPVVPVGSTASPAQVTGNTNNSTSISANNYGTCAVIAGGAKCWGQGFAYRLGNGSEADAYAPVQVTGLTSGATAISTGPRHSCAVVSGAARCWGWNTAGQIGIPGAPGVATPVTGGAIFSGAASAAPVATDQTVSAPRGVATHVVLAATDADSGTLTYSVVAEPSKGTLDCNGDHGEDCTYTASAGSSGADSFTFKANDGSNDSNTATVAITITNQAPTGDAVSVTAPRGTATPIALAGSDPNADPVTYAVASEPGKGSVECDGADCTYTAPHTASGSDTFTYTASDGDLTSAPATVTITITNQAPAADARSVAVARQTATPIPLSGSDANGDPLTFAVATGPAKGTLDCGDDSCTYTSNPGAGGADSFTYTASDGDLTSAPATVSIALAGSGSTALPQSLDAPRGVATPITLTGGDPDGDDLTYDVVDQPAKGSLDCTGTDRSECTYTASPGTTGTDSFTFSTTDADGTSEPATVTITITNQAPVASAQTVNASAPTNATSVTLAAIDPNGDEVSYDVVDPPSKGSLSCSSAGLCTYTARAGTTGTDRFTFRSEDGFGGSSAIAAVTLALDSTTPGVFLGSGDKVEPESGTTSSRGMALPVTLSQPSPVPLTVWYWTADGTATAGSDFTRFGTQAAPRSVTVPAGSTWATIAPPIKDDSEVEGDEVFHLRIAAITGGPAYIGAPVGDATIHDADGIARADAATPVLSIASVRQVEGNGPASRKAQVRLELSKPLTQPLTLRWSTASGTAVAGRDFTAKSNVAVTIKPGTTEISIDLALRSNATIDGDRSFAVAISAINGPTVELRNTTGVVTILDDDA